MQTSLCSKIIHLVPGFIMLILASIYGQAPDTSWTVVISEPSSDVRSDARQTEDGGFIMSTGSLLTRLNQDGGQLWQVNLKDSWPLSLNTFRVQETSAGQFITVGDAEAIGGGTDHLLANVTANGDSASLSLSNLVYIESSRDVVETADGHYVLAGYTSGLTAPASASSSPSASTIGLSLIKMTAAGDTLWTRVFEGLEPFDGSAGYSIIETDDGGLLVTGATSIDLGGSLHVWLIKTDLNGDSLWTRTYTSGAKDIARSIIAADDGGYFIGAQTTPLNSDREDYLLLRLDENAELLWSKTYGGEQAEFLGSICKTDDGGVLITGTTYSFGAGSGDIWLVRVTASGEIGWTKTLGTNHLESGYSGYRTTDGGYIVSGSRFSGPDPGSWLIKLEKDPTGIEQPTNSTLPQGFWLAHNFPNPFNPITTITFHLPYSAETSLKIYDINGGEIRTLLRGNHAAGEHQVVWDGRNDSGNSAASGVYIYELRTDGQALSRKMTLLR